MLNSLKSNQLKHLPPKVIIEHSQNNLNNNQKLDYELLKNDNTTSNDNKILMPKIFLNNKKTSLLKNKKRNNSMGKIDNDFDKYFVKKESFIFCPRNQEIINYYDKKNKNYILSLNNINRTKQLVPPKKLAKIKYLKINKDKSTETNETMSCPRIQSKKRIYKSSSLPEYSKNEDNYNKFFESQINQSSNSLIDSNSPKLLIDLKKYINKRKKEKNYLNILINNANNEDDLNIYKKMKTKQKKYFPRRYNLIKTNQLFQEKKVDKETLAIISKENQKIKSFLEPKFNKKEEKFKILMLRKNLLQDKLNKNNDFNKYIYKPKSDNNIVVDNQIELLKRKINSKNFTNTKNIELSNSFISQLFLSISNPYEQLFNTRLYGKLIDDISFLKELHKNEKMKFNE